MKISVFDKVNNFLLTKEIAENWFTVVYKENLGALELIQML